MLAQVRLGADPADEKTKKREALTVGELLDLFDQQYIGTMVKPGTAVSHRIALGELRRAYGSVKAAALSRAQVALLHTQMADRPYAANRAVAVWGKAFNWGAARGLVQEGHNPTKGIQKYREQGRERYLTSEELARLGAVLADGETIGLSYDVDEDKPKAKHAAKPENRCVKLDPLAVAAIRLLILTGARLREILDAQWSQVDLERGIIFLADSKTGRKPIYLSAAAQAVLAALPRVEGNPHIVAGAKEGAPRADLKKPWASCLPSAGLEGVRLHDLRHSFASFGAGASLGLPIIGKLLGHSQAATTHRYAHLDADPCGAQSILSARRSLRRWKGKSARRKFYEIDEKRALDGARDISHLFLLMAQDSCALQLRSCHSFPCPRAERRRSSLNPTGVDDVCPHARWRLVDPAKYRMRH